MRAIVLIGLCVFLLPSGTWANQKKERKLPDKVKDILTKATSFELYSLEPTEDQKPAEKPARLHGWKILGKTAIKRSDKTGKEILAALDKGVSEARSGAKCFDPRHAIHAECEGKSVDVLICFQCRWVYVYFDGKKEEVHQIPISRSAETLFDKVLRDAKIPLAKKAE